MKSLLKCILKKHYDRQLEADQNEFIETHYREVENMYQKMRGWRHDYHNHIQTLKFLAANNDIVGIREYLNELDTNLSILDNSIRTGNSMADAILNSKVSLAKAREIDVRVDAHIPVKLKISEIDLCCILGNLFDNAIDASMALPPQNRLIRVYMDMKGSRLYISFTNFTSQKKLGKLGRVFATTKGLGHGLGLSRIENIVEKHDGYLSFNSEDGAVHCGNTSSAGIIACIFTYLFHTFDAILHSNVFCFTSRRALLRPPSAAAKLQFVPANQQFVPEICSSTEFRL